MTGRILKAVLIIMVSLGLSSGLTRAGTLSAEVTFQPAQNNKASGFAVFTPQAGGLEVTGFVSSLPSGTYRLLIDEGNSCATPPGIALGTTAVMNTDAQGRLKFVSTLPVLTIEPGNRTIIARRAIIQATETRTAAACGLVFAR